MLIDVIEVIEQDVAVGAAASTDDLRLDLVAVLERLRHRLCDPVFERGLTTGIEGASVDTNFAEVHTAFTANSTKTVRAV